ncbi:S1C family serine protease [Alkalibacter mobilis]|uniref:S1C family serine protease n=1 Tax=Alkalibacter mobilis TaxID=2787712 RepID=UPI00189F7EF1|nr:trypsin-like peptidase domain-containing protein [Alkalibacter mobilis]MBF7096623.1 trypsin-like peptidase domain-containing protein [Alkalibacter mobilis]
MMSKNMRKKVKLAMIGLIVSVVILSGSCAGDFEDISVDKNVDQVSILENSQGDAVSVVYTEVSSSEEMTIPQIYTASKESVVEITTETVESDGRMGQYVSSGAGSGVVVSKDGYIATNYHVIEGAGKITVILSDGTSNSASVIGFDSKTDMAVLKIHKEGLVPVIFGDSDALVVGELALAIGNPLGELGGTLTEGIISALDRDIVIDNESMNLLQTSAAINPGNSGGGLFNSKGELIGVVNAKSSGSNIEGLGFAIPSNTAKEVIVEIIENGYVTGRADLGVELVEISDTRTAMAYRVDALGVYVAKVEEETELKAGDLLVEINGDEIESINQVNNLVEDHSVGDALKIKVLRDGAEMELSVKLGEETN